jgi:hypothetical protein
LANEVVISVPLKLETILLVCALSLVAALTRWRELCWLTGNARKNVRKNVLFLQTHCTDLSASFASDRQVLQRRQLPKPFRSLELNLHPKFQTLFLALEQNQK